MDLVKSAQISLNRRRFSWIGQIYLHLCRFS